MTIYRLSILITCLTALAVAYTIFSIAPEMQLPVHWNAAGQADRYTDASNALLFPVIAMVAVVVLVPLLKFIEPRKGNIQQSRVAIDSIVAAIVLFLLVLELGYFAMIAGYEPSMDKLILSAVGSLFVIMGNFLGKTRSNFYIGIRTPWTLSSDEVWRKTHRLGGPLFMISGLILAASVWFAPDSVLKVVVLGAILPAALIPVVYSWWLYRKLDLDSNDNMSEEQHQD